jgi:sarcosine oxidase subunit gamma
MADFVQRSLTLVNVRASGDVVHRVGAALGLTLPVESNTVATDGERDALWLGPDEWLLIDARESAERIEATVRSSFAPDWGSVVDVSANCVAVDLSGPTARDLLARACSLDLHPRKFGTGRCAQTLLAGTHGIVWQIDNQPTFRLLVRASYKAHLARWLADVERDMYAQP